MLLLLLLFILNDHKNRYALRTWVSQRNSEFQSVYIWLSSKVTIVLMRLHRKIILNIRIFGRTWCRE